MFINAGSLWSLNISVLADMIKGGLKVESFLKRKRMQFFVISAAVLMFAAAVLAADIDPHDSSDATYTDEDYLIIQGSSSTVFDVYRGDTGTGHWSLLPILTNAATIQIAVDYVKADAAGSECSITFDGATSLAGLGTAVLYVGQAGITFNNTGTAWSVAGVTLYGKLSTTYATTTYVGLIVISDGVIVNSYVSIDYAIGNGGYAIFNIVNGKLNVMGGTISTTDGRAIWNNVNGTLNVYGGKISATKGSAIYGSGAGKITVSEDPALPGSTLISTTGGYTIDIIAVTGNTDVRLEITGGKVQNSGVDATTATVVRNASAGIVNITGGTLQNTGGTGDVRTINNSSTGTVNISGGTVQNDGTNSSTRAILTSGPVNISGGLVKAYAGPAIVTSGGNSPLTISGGTVSSTNSHAIYAESGFAAITIFDDPGIPGAPLVSGGGHGINLSASGATASDTMYVNISGGTVQTTLYNGLNAIYSNSPRTVVNISGNALIQNNNPASVAAGNSWVINNNHYGTVNISGNAVIKDNSGSSANNIRLIQNGSVGIVNISGGTLTTSTGIAVANQSAGTYNISGGMIGSGSNVAILCQGSGKVTIYEDPLLPAPWIYSGGPYTISIANIAGNTSVRVDISGGNVRNSGSAASSCHAIYNNSTSVVNISGGTVDNYTTGGGTSGDTWTINNAAAGTINISGGTIMNDSSGTGSRVINNAAGGTINISQGGIIGRATVIHNASTGAVNVSGGTVNSLGSYAIYCQGVGKVTISADLPDPGYTSVVSNSIYTIYIANVVGDASVRLEITGGLVANSGLPDMICYTIYNASAGSVNISGGEVAGYEEWIEYLVVFNASAGTINISGGSVKSYSTEAASKVVVNNAGGKVNVSGGTVSAGLATSIQNVSTGTVNVSGGRVITTTGTAILNNNSGTVNITGGEVSATTGYAIYCMGTGKVTVSYDPALRGAPLVKSAGQYTVFIGNVPGDTSTRLEISGGKVQNTGTVNNSCHAIYNASLGVVLIHGDAVVENSAASGATWTINNASAGTVIISGGTVQNLSNDAGMAVYNNSSGVVNITGGTILINGPGKAIYNSTGKIYLGGAPDITGTIYTAPSTLFVQTALTAIIPHSLFNPGAKTYDLELSSEGNGYVAVVDGTTFLNNFVYKNVSVYMLKDNNADLILVVAVVITVGTSPDTLGIEPMVADADSLPVAGTAVGNKWTFRVEKDSKFTISVPLAVTVAWVEWIFNGWADDAGASDLRTFESGVSEDSEFTALYEVPIVPPVLFDITATSDAGSAITPSGVVLVPEGDSQTFIFGAIPGFKITEVLIDGSRLLSQPEIDLGEYTFTEVAANHSISVTSEPESKEDVTTPRYTITAASDSGSIIAPSGVITVQAGNNQSFVFAAKDGYRIVDVLIDGHYLLTQAQIDSGMYTFTNVMADHTISVKSIPYSKDDVTLRIDVMEGTGYAEYSVNGGPFVKYTGVVTLPAGTDLVVRAVAGDGYVFDRWETPAVTKDIELSFENLRGALHLDLFFASEKDSGNQIPWTTILIASAGLALAAALLFFGFFWRPPRVTVKVKLLATGSAALEGVRMIYEVNGKPKESVHTNEKGVYVIRASIGDEVEILLLSKEGHTVVEHLPHKMQIEKRTSELHFTMKKNN